MVATMIKNKLNKVIDSLASVGLSQIQLSAIFVTTVILRNLLESISAGILFPPAAFLFHFPAAYIFPMLGLTLLLNRFSGYPVNRLMKLMVLAWTLTLLPPIIDILTETTSAIGYFPLERGNAGHFLLNFFNPGITLPGTTTGIRIEAALGCLLAGLFTWAVSKRFSILRGILTTVVFAPVFLVFFTWPGLIHIAVSGIFPFATETQELMRWHTATTSHLIGAVHYTLFIIDIIPVIVFSALLAVIAFPKKCSGAVRRVTSRFEGIIIILAGSLALIVSLTGIMTFADAVSIAGAAVVGILLFISLELNNTYKMILILTALWIAVAIGWLSFILALLTAAVIMLPIHRCIRRGFIYILLFFISWSPSAIPAGNILLAIVIFAFLAGAIKNRFALVPAVSVLISGLFLSSLHPAAIQAEYYSNTADNLNRSGRQNMAIIPAEYSSAAGGNILTYARAELSAGEYEKARWGWKIASSLGDSTPDCLKTGLNLAYLMDNPIAFDSLLLLSRESGAMESIDPTGLMITMAVQRADTTLLNSLQASAGSSPYLFGAFAGVFIETGDYEKAAEYAYAAISHPDATVEHYALAIHLSALLNEDFETYFDEGISKYPTSVPLMLALLQAELATTGSSSRYDILDLCLRLNPFSDEVLETAADFYLASDKPDSALIMAERCITVQDSPGFGIMELVCRAGYESEKWSRLEASAEYAKYLFPNRLIFDHYLTAARDSARSAILNTDSEIR